MYRVEFTPFADRYYLKKFEKKYRTNWLVTRKALVAKLSNIDTVVESSKATIIHNSQRAWVVKMEFAVARVDSSAHGSGNRLIVYVDHTKLTAKVLLIYSKNEISEPNETQKWQQIIKAQYPEVWAEFSD